MNTITKYARNAQDVLARTGRSSQIVGWGTPPVVPYEQDGWTLQILKSYSTLPSEVKERLRILQKGGVKFTHVLIAHEQYEEPKWPQEIVNTAKSLLPVLGAITVALVKVLGVVLLVVGRILLFFITVDPVVIVVLEDGSWLEIAKWYD